MVPFDWDTIPRGSVGDLGSWRGFRGLSGDLVRKVIQELHPYAQVEFRAESDSLLGPPTRKNNHGYLVRLFSFINLWTAFGCVLCGLIVKGAGWFGTSVRSRGNRRELFSGRGRRAARN